MGDTILKPDSAYHKATRVFKPVSPIKEAYEEAMKQKQAEEDKDGKERIK